MADNTKKLTYVIEVNDKGKIKIDGLTKSFVGAGTAVKALNKDLAQQATIMANNNRVNQNMIDKTGLAGATLVELGRTVSDFNYGIRGMANNLSQVSTLFITLISTTGGLKEGLGELWKVLKGPLGIILAFQTVLTIIEGYSMKQEEAARKTKKSTDAIKEQINAIEDLNSKINALEQSLSIINTFGEGFLSLSEITEILNRKFKDFQNGFNRLSEDQKKDPKIIASLVKAYQQYTLVREKLNQKQLKALELQRKITKEGEFVTKGGLRTQNPAVLALSSLNREIAELLKQETRLFDIFKKIEGKFSKETPLVESILGPEKVFADIDAKGKVVARDLYEDVTNIYKIVMQTAKDGVDELSELGRQYNELVEGGEESLKNGLDAIKSQAQDVTKLFKATQQSLGYINDVVMSYHEARMAALSRERDYVLHSGNLTAAQQRKAIADIEKRELKAQERKIKSERDLFTIKQSLLIAEELMKIKADFAERKRMFDQQTIYFVNAQGRIVAKAAESTADASFSIGEFVRQLGPLGIAAYALTIGGLIASIVAARKKAQASLSALGAPSGSGGGGIGLEAPDFNVVGASPESQLAQSVSAQQQKPLRAFIVHKDIKNANELERNIQNTSALG